MDSPSVETSTQQSASNANSNTTHSIAWDWFTIIQFILALFGILGNILVIIVYVKKLRNQSNSNKLIVMLAVADLITSVALIPVPSVSYVPNSAAGWIYCVIVPFAVIMWISVISSVFILTLLSLERYLAIVHPTKHKNVFKKQRIKYFILTVWLSATALHYITAFVSVSNDNQCVIIWPSSTFQALHGVMVFLIEFAIPIAVMAVSHYCAIKELQKQAKKLLERKESLLSPASSLLQCRSRVIRMVLIVIMTFIICWLPDQIGFLLYNTGVLKPVYLASPTYQSLTVLAFINSSANPIIYICLNKNFRLATIQLVPRFKQKIGNFSVDGGAADIQLPNIAD